MQRIKPSTVEPLLLSHPKRFILNHARLVFCKEYKYIASAIHPVTFDYDHPADADGHEFEYRLIINFNI